MSMKKIWFYCKEELTERQFKRCRMHRVRVCVCVCIHSLESSYTASLTQVYVFKPVSVYLHRHMAVLH